MRKMLLQHYFRNMESQLLVVPLFSLFYIGVILLFEQSSFAFSSSVIMSVYILTLMFLQLYRGQEKMFAVMPIPKKALIQVKFTFLLSTAILCAVLSFTLYAFFILFQGEWVWDLWLTVAGMSLFFALLIVNLLLLIDNIPVQAASAIILILPMWGLFLTLFLKPAILLWVAQVFHNHEILLTAIVIIFLATVLNYRLSVLLSQKIDVP